MLHISPSKKQPNQPPLVMDPYYFNFAGPHPSVTEYAQTAQSTSQDTCVLSHHQERASDYLPTLPQTSYPVLGYDAQPSQTPEDSLSQPFYPSMGSGIIRTSSLPSSHPYQQARLRHAADRASAQHRGWCPPHFPTIPLPASDTVSLHSAAIADRTSTRCHDTRHLPLRSAPPVTLGLASQSSIVAPNTNQIMPSSMSSLMLSGQAFLSTCETRASPPPPSYASADESDIEYAQYRYGNKRCFYQCRFDLAGSPCNKWIVGDRVRVLRHLRNHHHLQTGPAIPAYCRWDKCTHSRPMKQENLSRHVVMHLGVKWKCPHCRRLFSRDDAVHRHIERMVPGMNVPDAEVVPGCEARVINASQFKKSRIP